MLLITVASLATQVTIKWTKPTKPYGGADYERLNLGFRALKQSVPYEVVDKLLSRPLEYDRLLLMCGATNYELPHMASVVRQNMNYLI